jgi:predicted O-methyltransferase YrrM
MSQITPDPVDRYCQDLHAAVDPLLEEIGREGRSAGLPLVHPISARLLRTLTIATSATRILEIGTAIGYSALWMATAMHGDGHLITLEADAGRAATARANVERAGMNDRISIVVGDATRYLHKVSGPFDLIFQDSDKQLYEAMLDRLVDLLRPGGVLISDNILWSGEVVEGYVTPPQRDAKDTEALRAYNKRLAADSRLLTTFVPVGDGLAICVKVA